MQACRGPPPGRKPDRPCGGAAPTTPRRRPELGFTLDEVEELLHLDGGGPDSCDAARALAAARKADLEARIADLQRMRDSLADLVVTCDLPRADRRDRDPPTPPRASEASMSVTLEVLHVPDCPNVAPLMERLREATDLPVTTREITSAADAAAAGMRGSPTLLINGRDPFPTPILQGRDCGVSCRIYRDEHGRAASAPSMAQLRDALAAAGATAGRAVRSGRHVVGAAARGVGGRVVL